MELVFEERKPDLPSVEWIWRTQSEKDGSFISRAETRWEMVVTQYEGVTSLSVRGPETRASKVEYPQGMEFFGMIFKLGTFIPYLPLNDRLDGKDITLPEAADKKFWLLGKSWEYPNFENADTFLSKLLNDKILVNDPIVDSVLQDRPLDMSLRSIQRRFAQATGLSYKTIQQIDRARLAMTLIEQGVSIMDTVFETGYYDQSHLTNSLARYMGQTPAEIAQTAQVR